MDCEKHSFKTGRRHAICVDPIRTWRKSSFKSLTDLACTSKLSSCLESSRPRTPTTMQWYKSIYSWPWGAPRDIKVDIAWSHRCPWYHLQLHPDLHCIIFLDWWNAIDITHIGVTPIDCIVRKFQSEPTAAPAFDFLVVGRVLVSVLLDLLW